MQGVGGSSPPSSTTSWREASVKLRWYREEPLRPDDGGAFCLTDEDGHGMTTIDATRQQTRDGRAWTLRAARPTDARALARLFADVRAEGRYLITPPTAVSEPSEAFFIGEMIRGEGSLALVAEADGEVIGNVLIGVERNAVERPCRHAVASAWRTTGATPGSARR